MIAAAGEEGAGLQSATLKYSPIPVVFPPSLSSSIFSNRSDREQGFVFGQDRRGRNFLTIVILGVESTASPISGFGITTPANQRNCSNKSRMVSPPGVAELFQGDSPPPFPSPPPPPSLSKLILLAQEKLTYRNE
ncbi:hypothetical protein RHMOL_Rhmol02G0136000 [Rhododendron molle]|uniref:Uncharacterized protein n=1 Tax=Rhododendron molle TaxID=49168 RepID=A0ACC0PSH1_RHOML|nr:hypothetical protein RHMOL_Rhmol02G0136000 [Rhododendron molle]